MCLCVYSVNLILKTIYVTAVHTHRERPVTAVPLIKCRGVLLLLLFFVYIFTIQYNNLASGISVSLCLCVWACVYMCM